MWTVWLAAAGWLATAGGSGSLEWAAQTELDRYEVLCRRDAGYVHLAGLLLGIVGPLVGLVTGAALIGLWLKLRTGRASFAELRAALFVLRRSGPAVALPPGHAEALLRHLGGEKKLNKAFQQLPAR